MIGFSTRFRRPNFGECTMPQKDYSFPGLIADNQGKIAASKSDSQPVSLTLDRVIVRSTSGCRSRSHPVTATLSGGVDFRFNGAMSDCTDLGIDLGSLSLPAFSSAVVAFELSGFDPGENVDLEGTLFASYAFLGPQVDATDLVRAIEHATGSQVIARPQNASVSFEQLVTAVSQLVNEKE
jgi:hypothetical protein